jgi:mRNA interferase MazF
MEINRGDVFLINLDPVKGSEEGKTRPCVVIQNNIGNKFSKITIVASITSNIDNNYPFIVKIKKGDANLPKDSAILLNQINTISEERIIKKIGCFKENIIKKINSAIKFSLDLE